MYLACWIEKWQKHKKMHHKHKDSPYIGPNLISIILNSFDQIKLDLILISFLLLPYFSGLAECTVHTKPLAYYKKTQSKKFQSV